MSATTGPVTWYRDLLERIVERSPFVHCLGPTRPETCKAASGETIAMPTQESKAKSPRELIDALKAARDQVRVQAHLLSMDAKKRWQELEAGLTALQSSVERDGEQMAAEVAARFRETTQAVRDFLGEVDGVFELAAPVRKLMKAPTTCSPDDSLARAAQIMWDVDCGAVPVVDSGGALVGMITDRDVCMAAYTQGAPLASMTVGTAMSKQVFSCAADASIGQAVRLMANKQVRRLPVTTNGKLVGLISLADVARDIRKQGGSRIPACLVLADTIAAICEQKPTGNAAQRAAE